MKSAPIVAGAAVALAALARTTAAPPAALQPQDRFDHEQHRGLFPSCLICHAGAAAPGAALYPDPASCAECHDGTVEEQVEWAGPEHRPRTNLRFDHARHADTLAAVGRDAARCVECHSRPDSAWMFVQVAVAEQCLDCHGIRETHYAAQDADCALCHVPLAAAARLTEEEIAAFPEPPSHQEPGFRGRGGHGLLAYQPVEGAAREGVAVACATCHARDFCAQCHVDAPEQPSVRALQRDPRSLVHRAALEEPASHADPAFVRSHGPTARLEPAECRTCHTQESCLACHLATPQAAARMYAGGPERSAGAVVRREPPDGHRGDFVERHGTEAAAAPQTCAACHVRADCLECHRPGAAAVSPGYHSVGFLTRHPAAAYARESSCSDCHSPTQFCAACHQASGLVAERSLLGAGYHDARQSFILGHGPAARQNLESCVSCHVERDCLTCHSALGGRRFSPHGPGFDADRLRRRNPEMCSACHGLNIPGS